MKLYRFVGVGAFRKLVLFVEKIVHLKDGAENLNYHPRNLSLPAVERFSCYLIFNSSVHILSIFCAVLLSVITPSVEIYILSAVIILVNLYCIMLQRFNYLALKRHADRERTRIARYEKQLVNSADVYGAENRAADLQLLGRLCRCFYVEDDCIIDVCDIPCLERMAKVIFKAGNEVFGKRLSKKSCSENETSAICDLAKRAQRENCVYSAATARTAVLMKILRRKGRRADGRICVVTENADCERLFRQIFPVDSAECWFATLSALEAIIKAGG